MITLIAKRCSPGYLTDTHALWLTQHAHYCPALFFAAPPAPEVRNLQQQQQAAAQVSGDRSLNNNTATVPATQPHTHTHAPVPRPLLLHLLEARHPVRPAHAGRHCAALAATRAGQALAVEGLVRDRRTPARAVGATVGAAAADTPSRRAPQRAGWRACRGCGRGT
jgi:hypothetical protein